MKDSVGAFQKPSSNMGMIKINCKISNGDFISGVQAYNISQYPGEIFISDENGIILIPLNPGSHNILLKSPIDCSINTVSLNVISQYAKTSEYNITATRLSSNVGFVIESGLVTISKSCTLDICTVGGGGGGGYHVFTGSRFAVASGGGGGYVSNNTISYVAGDVLQIEVGAGGYYDGIPMLAGKTTVKNLRTNSIVSTANGGLNGDVRGYDGSGNSLTVVGGVGNGAGGGAQYSSSAYKTTLTPAPLIGSTYEFGDSTRTKFGGGGGACGKDGYNNDQNVSIVNNGAGFGAKGFNTDNSTSAPESIGQNGTGGGGGGVSFKRTQGVPPRNNMGYGGSGRASFRWR